MKTKLTSPNISGTQWITRLENKGFTVGSYAKVLLNTIIPTKNTYEYVILKMDKDSYTTQEVRDEAKKRGYITPPAELAPLLREKISDEEIEQLGLWWLIVMHEPITDSDGGPYLLSCRRRGGGRWLRACGGGPTRRWGREYGFVFLAPQVSALGTGDSELIEPLPLEKRLKNVEQFMRDNFKGFTV